MNIRWVAIAGAGLLVTACTSSGNVERNAAGGAVRGCQQDGGCGAAYPQRRQFYDQRLGRYYYYDQGSGRYYWENGEPKY